MALGMHRRHFISHDSETISGGSEVHNLGRGMEDQKESPNGVHLGEVSKNFDM